MPRLTCLLFVAIACLGIAPTHAHSSVHMDMAMSESAWKMSSCLRRNTLAKAQ